MSWAADHRAVLRKLAAARRRLNEAASFVNDAVGGGSPAVVAIVAANDAVRKVAERERYAFADLFEDSLDTTTTEKAERPNR